MTVVPAIPLTTETLAALAGEAPNQTPTVGASPGETLTGGLPAQSKVPSKRKGRVAATPINAWTKPSDLLPFRPFEKSPRGEQWAVSDQGKQWISQRIPSFSNMEPPGGLPTDEVTNRVMTHRQWWTSELSKMYMANWPNFDSEEVLGTQYTPKQKVLHDERVISFIEYALRRQRQGPSVKESASDLLSLLVNRVRKPVPYNLWAQHDDAVDTDARELAQQEARWEDTNNHISVLMEKRKLLFEQLPQEKQAYWITQAAEAKAPALTPEEFIAAIPKVYGMMGDSYRDQIDFHGLVICGGKSPNGEISS
ncbi:hypothetical protein M422DRAFT_255271 [Sphaerobolus stellatus SS14]|uniref:Uncharacterized protein n=1 Tax=Sphaerobolus stellatus (strain SS14) TaxID=990650 RepID=A0A0C9UF56_SPHS4|nr:hypothetical protein M422DRAFT_255271 [Sphaerobolus stellatus SS14]